MSYNEWVTEYPSHIIIMKMGHFYSALDHAAEVVSYCTGYRLGAWPNGTKITGAPTTDKMERDLQVFDVNYLIIENDHIC